jgi:hypothetical protein
LDFNLPCSGGDTPTCKGGVQGTTTTTTTTDANGNQTTTSTFTATVISSDSHGNLTDQNGNRYTGTFDGKNVIFTKVGSTESSIGAWKQGTNDTKGIRGTGDFNKFDFTFTNHNSVQTLAATFYFHGTLEEASAALEKAGFVHWALGFHFGQTEFREDVEGRDSFHFSLSGVILDPESYLPLAFGDLHNNEYYAGTHMLNHFWYDVLKQ